MHKARLFVALSALGVLIYCAPVGAQTSGGPPDGPYIQVQEPPPPPPTTESSTVQVVSLAQDSLVSSTRLALGRWFPGLLQTSRRRI